MPLSVPRTYAELRSAVEATLLAGQRQIEHAKVRTYWETGWFINEHILLKADRAEYGAQVYHQLERDLHISRRVLYHCSQFARLFPIVNGRSQLNWAHYRALCQVEDPAERKSLLRQTTVQAWNSTQLEARVRELNLVTANDDSNGTDRPAEKPELLKPRRGTPGLHPIVDRGDGPAVDLGFRLYRELPSTGLRAGGSTSKLTTSDIVRLNEGGVRRVDGATKAELFTYTATIRRVVDGDTLVVALAVAPGITLELKLRLRGLDCPEMSTAAGRAAKRFVDSLVHPGDEVILCTTKPDKYDWYLADVFIRQESADRGPVTGNGGEVFLNNALLESGHAVRYDDVGPKEL